MIGESTTLFEDLFLSDDDECPRKKQTVVTKKRKRNSLEENVKSKLKKFNGTYTRKVEVRPNPDTQGRKCLDMPFLEFADVLNNTKILTKVDTNTEKKELDMPLLDLFDQDHQENKVQTKLNRNFTQPKKCLSRKNSRAAPTNSLLQPGQNQERIIVSKVDLNTKREALDMPILETLDAPVTIPDKHLENVQRKLEVNPSKPRETLLKPSTSFNLVYSKKEIINMVKVLNEPVNNLGQPAFKQVSKTVTKVDSITQKKVLNMSPIEVYDEAPVKIRLQHEEKQQAAYSKLDKDLKPPRKNIEKCNTTSGIVKSDRNGLDIQTTHIKLERNPGPESITNLKTVKPDKQVLDMPFLNIFNASVSNCDQSAQNQQRTEMKHKNPRELHNTIPSRSSKTVNVDKKLLDSKLPAETRSSTGVHPKQNERLECKLFRLFGSPSTLSEVPNVIEPPINASKVRLREIQKQQRTLPAVPRPSYLKAPSALPDPRLQRKSYLCKRPMELLVPSWNHEKNSSIIVPPCKHTPKRFKIKINNRRFKGSAMARARKLEVRGPIFHSWQVPILRDDVNNYDENKQIVVNKIFGRMAKANK